MTAVLQARCRVLGAWSSWQYECPAGHVSGPIRARADREPTAFRDWFAGEHADCRSGDR